MEEQEENKNNNKYGDDRYEWRKDKDSKKYKEWAAKKREAMRKVHRRRLEAKNKRPPKKVRDNK